MCNATLRIYTTIASHCNFNQKKFYVFKNCEKLFMILNVLKSFSRQQFLRLKNKLQFILNCLKLGGYILNFKLEIILFLLDLLIFNCLLL